MNTESYVFQHYEDNIQLLDRLSNRAKYTQTPLEADLNFYAILTCNVTGPAIGQDRVTQIINGIREVLDVAEGPASQLRSITRLGQDQLTVKADELRSRLLDSVKATNAVASIRVKALVPQSMAGQPRAWDAEDKSQCAYWPKGCRYLPSFGMNTR